MIDRLCLLICPFPSNILNTLFLFVFTFSCFSVSFIIYFLHWASTHLTFCVFFFLLSWVLEIPFFPVVLPSHLFLNFHFVSFLHGDDGFMYTYYIHRNKFMVKYWIIIFMYSLIKFLVLFISWLVFSSFPHFFPYNAMFGCCVLAFFLLCSTRRRRPDRCVQVVLVGAREGRAVFHSSRLSSLLLQRAVPTGKFVLGDALGSPLLLPL